MQCYPLVKAFRRSSVLAHVLCNSALATVHIYQSALSAPRLTRPEASWRSAWALKRLHKVPLYLSQSFVGLMRGARQLSAHQKCLRDLFCVRDHQTGCARSLATALPYATEKSQGTPRYIPSMWLCMLITPFFWGISKENSCRSAPGNVVVDASEVSKFSAMAAEWWDPRGPMAPLHSMNPTRVKFCRDAITDHRGCALFCGVHPSLACSCLADLHWRTSAV